MFFFNKRIIFYWETMYRFYNFYILYLYTYRKSLHKKAEKDKLKLKYISEQSPLDAVKSSIRQELEQSVAYCARILKQTPCFG